MPTGPAADVEPIDPEAEPAIGGLLQSVQVIFGGDSEEARRWENGFSYRPRGSCGPGSKWAPCSGAIRPPEQNVENRYYSPFVVYAAGKCSAGYLTQEEREDAARTALEWFEGDQVALELWRGDLAIGMWEEALTADPTLADDRRNAFLAAPSSVKLTDPNTGPGTAEVSPLMYALSNLQQALRECLGDRRRGVIHATAGTVALWMDGAAVAVRDGQLRDQFGNLVVASGGYDGSSPVTLNDAGEVTDGGELDPSGRTAWAYATGPVVVRLSPVSVTPETMGEAMQRATNDVTFEASRTAAAYFDPCCHFAVNVDLCNKACSAEDGS